jgi:hypothetical protein
MYIENNVLTLTLGSSVTTYALSNASYDTLTELVTVLDAVTSIDCTLIAAGTTSSILLNPISKDYKANIKTLIYTAGYSNYTTPKKLCSLVRRDADKIQQSWLDEADAFIENMTGYVFKSTTITSTNLDISEKDIYTNTDYCYTYTPSYNALILRDYTPVSTLTTLTVNSQSVTASYVIIDGNTLILSTDAETTTWIPGRAKATVTLTYGYSATSKEGILASEYATLYIIQKYFVREMMDAKLSGGTVQHMDVVISEGVSVEELTRREISSRMKEIEKSLPTKQRYAIG